MQRKNGVIVEEVDDIEETKEIKSDEAKHPQKTPAFNPEYSNTAVSIYNGPLTFKPGSLPTSIKQQTKDTDDSKTAYGEKFSSTFGARKFAPIPTEPSAPPLDEDNWEEYQQWMNATTFADRASFPNHKRWNEILQHNQDQFRLDANKVFQDKISKTFRDSIRNEQKGCPLLNGHHLPPNYWEITTYKPLKFASQIAERKSDYIDQVQDMMAWTDQHFKISYAKGKIMGQEIANNHFYVVSDHNGAISGKHLQIWGAGYKKSLNMASMSEKQSLGKVEGSAESYDINIDYAHVANRFTIIRINANEIGFVLHKESNRIEKIVTGRYVIPENTYAYIGKTSLQPGNAALPVRPHLEEKNIVQIANQLQIVLVTPGKIAFIKDNYNTYLLEPRIEPYVLDKRRGEQFINFENANQQVIRAADGSYTYFNQLQPGQFILFKYQSQVIVWPYDEENPAFNSLYLPANQFQSDNLIHNINEPRVAWEGINVINTNPGQVAVVQNKELEIRFIEDNQAKMFVLRMPWKFVDVVNKNQDMYRAGSQNIGNETVRLMLRSSEWAAVLSQNGHLAFYPPRLDNQPYYFSQPEHLVIGVINKNEAGRKDLNVPGIGVVSVVNIPSGQIGACRMRNMHFFLNPSPHPYIFTPPDVFIGLIDAKQSHYANGDLHRIVLAPDEQAVIVKDGELYRLPSDTALSGENGVYIFRAGQFSFEGGGPKKKSEKNCPLGPINFFVVGVGEVGYGTINGELKTWGVGHHSVDNRKNEWFTNFFSTNVDPVNIQDLDVTFKHGITGKVNVFVSYHIEDPEKAIRQFKDHNVLHQFIDTTTRAEMLKLCASRPPLGYTDLDFRGAETKNINATSVVEENAVDAVKAIQHSFLVYAKTLLEKYGVSISDMYINDWKLAQDFVKQVQDNAKILQNAHAEVAKAQIALQKSELENKQRQQTKENEILLQQKTKQSEIDFQDLENKKLALSLEAARLKQVNDAKTNADIKVAQTTAEVESNKAIAKGKADIKTLEAKAQVDSAEQTALAATAKDRTESKAQQEIAQNRFAAKKAETDAQKLEIEVQKAKGEAEAAIASAKEQARFAGLNAEQRLQLELAERQAKIISGLLELAIKTNTQVPGLFTLNERVFELSQLPAITTQRNTANPFALFGLQPQQPMEDKRANQVLRTNQI